MSLPRKLSEASSDQKDVDDPRIKELEMKAQERFYDAMFSGQVQNVSHFLLSTHIHPDAKVHTFNPLALVCVWGEIEIAEFFIMNGAFIEGHNSNTLCSAIGGNNPEKCVELLLRHKANVNARNICGYTPLMFRNNSTEVTKLLLRHQADVNATEDGKTPLDFAREYNTSPGVIRLLESVTKEKEEKNSAPFHSWRCAIM